MGKIYIIGLFFFLFLFSLVCILVIYRNFNRIRKSDMPDLEDFYFYKKEGNFHKAYECLLQDIILNSEEGLSDEYIEKCRREFEKLGLGIPDLEQYMYKDEKI